MQKKHSFETQLTRLFLVASLPLLVLLIWVMFYAGIDLALILLVGFLSTLVVAYCFYQIKHKSEYQFRSISNLLDAMSQGEYSLRARSDRKGSALDELVTAINGLAERLSEQRRVSAESQRLLQTVIDHIDVAIVALDDVNQLSFFNPAAKKLLRLDGANGEDALAHQLSFLESIQSGSSQVIELTFGQQQGRFNVHVEAFREGGKQHKLLFLTDVRTLLRSEERKAWKSLVRVISHEINNSLSPIASVSQTLKRQIERQQRDEELYDDLNTGLTLILERTKGLGEFIDSYKQLARLPEPQKRSVQWLDVVKKISDLFNSDQIIVKGEENFQIDIDPVQIEQVLINLLKNALEAMQQSQTSGLVTITWKKDTDRLVVCISDQGPGIKNPENLFVPFYSTKKHGSGIGLVLCRQIVEAHGGMLTLHNHALETGCCATFDLLFRVAQ